MTTTATAGRIARWRAARKLPPIYLDEGKTIRHAGLQGLFWAAVLGALAAAFVAGVYANFTQVDWHIHVGSLNWTWWNVKDTWDSLAVPAAFGVTFGSVTSWDLYRHGIRDFIEPALATVAVKTATAKQSAWDKPAPAWYVCVAPFLVAAAAIGLALGGIWLMDFRIPETVGWSTPPNHWVQFAGTLLIGAVIGQVCHRIWQSAGVRLQGAILDRSVDGYLLRRAGNPDLPVPLWIRKPIAPPQLRGRWVVLRSDPANVISARRGIPRWVLYPLCLLIAYFVITGLLFHFWVGVFHHDIPYLAPPE